MNKRQKKKFNHKKYRIHERILFVENENSGLDILHVKYHNGKRGICKALRFIDCKPSKLSLKETSEDIEFRYPPQFPKFDLLFESMYLKGLEDPEVICEQETAKEIY